MFSLARCCRAGDSTDAVSVRLAGSADRAADILVIETFAMMRHAFLCRLSRRDFAATLPRVRSQAYVVVEMLDSSQRDVPNRTRTPVATWLLAGITVLVFYLCWTMVAPFISVLTWAIALAIVVHPVRERLRKRMSDAVAAVVVVFLVVLAFTIVAVFVSHGLMHEAERARQAAAVLVSATAWQRLMQSQPWIGVVWQWFEPRVNLPLLAQQTSAAAASRIAPAVTRSVAALSRAAMSLFVLFFLIRDQDSVVRAIRRILPLTSAEIDAVWDRILSAMRASVYGRVVIGLIQGALGGIIFYAVGLPGALFWAAVMAVLAMLPVVGAFVVWMPAAAILLATGHWIRALVVVACGFAIIHPVDNVLYPLVVGPRIGLHPLILLIALLGGVLAFGAAGLALGPAIAACAIGLGEVWGARARA